MKKYNTLILIGSLVLLQLLTLAKVMEMNQELTATKDRLASIDTEVQIRINSIYSNINNSLKQQASIIDSFDYSIGEIDAVNYTIPVTFVITPKEATPSTFIKLFQSGNEYSMTRSGSSYMVTFPMSIFDRLNPIISIEDQGIEKIESLSVIEVMKHRVLPHLIYHYSHSPFYTQSNEKDVTWKSNGNLHLQINPVVGNTIESARLIVEIDDKVASNMSLHVNGQENKVKESHPIQPGQSLSFRIEAFDKIGLKYTTILDQVTRDVHGEITFEEDTVQNNWNNWSISDASGNILGYTEDSYE